jgi:hypothetical protein
MFFLRKDAKEQRFNSLRLHNFSALRENNHWRPNIGSFSELHWRRTPVPYIIIQLYLHLLCLST